MKTGNSKKLSEQIGNGIRLAGARALEDHKKAGVPIAVTRDGKVVIIPADEIIVPTNI